MCLGLHEVAEEYLDGAALLPGSTFLHTDVLPMLREMVNGDDQQEQAYNIALDIQADDVVLDARVRRSRRLAGSGKEGYRRHLDMSGEIANALRGSALPVQSNHTDNTGEVSNDSKDTIEGRDNSQNSERECEYRNAGAP